jgi:putative SOS response-associated peptidase YedK
LEPSELQAAFPGLGMAEAVLENYQPRYNIAPTQPVAVIPNDGQNRLDFYVWGLIPFWAKDPAIGSRMINARSETLAEKPSFKSALRRRRCLIPADGFYEWQANPSGKGKTPMYIRLQDGKPFAFAGLWERWNSPDGSTILSTTIITTRPNALMEPIHNRMPVILPSSAYAAWLTPEETDAAALLPLLEPYPAQAMAAYAVSTLVNSPAHDAPDLIQPHP